MAVEGVAMIAWLDDAFLIMHLVVGEHSESIWLFGRSDARDAFIAPIYDEHGILRMLDMTLWPSPTAAACGR